MESTARKTALRVLTRVTTGRRVNAADIAALRAEAPDLAHLAPDRLACEVVRRITQKRAKGRCPRFDAELIARLGPPFG
jgi:hypothetical protein